MSGIKTRWLTLAVCVLASLPLILLVGGNSFWAALALPILGWLVASEPDSLWPLAWIALAVVVWYADGTGSGWHTALVALSIASVHMASAIGARASNRARGWLKSDVRRFVGFLAASLLAMGVVGLVLLLPPLSGVIWVLGAVLLFGAVLIVVRFSVSNR